MGPCVSVNNASQTNQNNSSSQPLSTGWLQKKNSVKDTNEHQSLKYIFDLLYT